MSNPENQILARELGKVGSIGGPGSRSGASFAARFLPTETFRDSLRIEAEAREILQNVFRILASTGEITDECADASGPPRISAVVGSGFLKMNPALVHVQVVPMSERVSDVNISAAAKEGLIKQRTAEKAVGRFREELLKTYGKNALGSMILALERDDGSLFLFASATEAEAAFEAIDVENDEYEFCDRTGQRFVAEITAPDRAFRAASYRLLPSGTPDMEVVSRMVARASCLARGISDMRSINDLRSAITDSTI